MKTEIEQAVDEMLGEVDYSQIDFGEPGPKSKPPPAELPYPQGEDTEWFAIFHVFDRQDNWVRRVSAVLDTEDPLAAAAILVDAVSSYTGLQPEEAREAHQRWRDGEEEPFLYYAILTPDSTVAREGNGVALVVDDINAGIGQSREEAERMYVLSEPGEDAGEWQEV